MKKFIYTKIEDFQENTLFESETKKAVSQGLDFYKDVMKSNKRLGKSAGKVSSILDTFAKALSTSGASLPPEISRLYDKNIDSEVFPGEIYIGSTDEDLDKMARDKIGSEGIKKNEKIASSFIGTNSSKTPDYSKLGPSSYSPKGIGQYDDYKKLLEDKKVWNKLDKKKWNLIGIRNNISVRREYPNAFVDLMVLINPENKKYIEFPATTFPGIAYRVKPYRAWYASRGVAWLTKPPASEGVSILNPGVYDYKVGKYRGRPALVQSSNVSIDRYPLVDTESQAKKISTYSPGNTSEGKFGIFVHPRNPNSGGGIDNWSAGCQIPERYSDMEKIYAKAKENGGTIKYALVE